MYKRQEILSPDGKVVTRKENKGRINHGQPFEQNFIVNAPQLWSPESPALDVYKRQLYISNNDLRMNDIMKRLTIVSTIFIPLTFLVGVRGMNYKWMPELDWRYGYLLAWIIMAVIGIIVYLYFGKKKWY